MSRVIRQVTKLRRMLSKAVLSQSIETYVPADSPVREQMISFLNKIDEAMQVDETPATPATPPAGGETTMETEEEKEKSEEEKAKEKEVAAWHKKMLGVPEAEVFVQLLVTIFLLDKKALEDAIACASSLIQRAQSFNRR